MLNLHTTLLLLPSLHLQQSTQTLLHQFGTCYLSSKAATCRFQLQPIGCRILACTELLAV
jgi:hypothetical protein